MIPTYACSRHPDNFYQPDDFIPDRWLEDDVSRFGSLPFSFGARTCIGKRVAELVIRIALVQVSYLYLGVGLLVRKYVLEACMLCIKFQLFLLCFFYN